MRYSIREADKYGTNKYKKAFLDRKNMICILAAIYGDTDKPGL
jgi:hypothetical protein